MSWKYSRASNFAGAVSEPTENVTFYLPSYISVLPATSRFVHYLEEKKTQDLSNLVESVCAALRMGS